MPLHSPRGRRRPAPLASRLSESADVEHVAAMVAVIWREIDDALNPVIGHRGVAALYNRSLKLTSAAYPWLSAGHAGALDAVEPEALKAALLQQTAAEALGAGSAMFKAVHELLVSLIGPSLTDRLLQSVWAHAPDAPPAQDISP